MNILITGALGFFGLNLTRRLASQSSVHVIAADVRQPNQEQLQFLQPIENQLALCTLDVQDRIDSHELLNQKQISHIVHAAALTPTTHQEGAHPTQIVDINLGGTINLLDAATRTPSLQRVIVVSSSGVYGNSSSSTETTQHEDGPLTLNELYSITKYSGELLAQRYSELTGISMISVRLAPLYGPLERPSVSRPRISAVGQLMDALLNGRDISVAGPSVQRDWTFTTDAADAIMGLLQSNQLNHSVYNIGCGVAISWRQIVETFVDYGLSVTWNNEAAKADVAMRPNQERLAMDIARLQDDTRFVPQYGIDRGVADYLRAENAK